MSDDTYNQGLDVIRQMFGPEMAAKSVEEATEFSKPVNDMIIRYCFGETWNRPDFDHKTRSMLTLAMLVALGRGPEIKVHTKGAIANGVSTEEIRGILLHAMIYCGVPMAVNGLRSASEALQELGLE